jgi:beta-barrel assembly-enhancing protease
MRAKFLIRNRGLCSLLVGIVLLGAAQANVDPKKGRVTENPTSGNRYTIEQEIQIGQKGVSEVERQLKLLPPGHPMSKYINSLGQKLAAKAPGYKFPYTFKVVREKSINAFALPGGPVYVHTGLIEAATESELAGVMGHEISHVVMRHSTRQASRQMKAQLPLAILGGILGAGVGGWAGSLAQMGISMTAGSVLMKYSRESETEADMVGAQIIYDAGYNPRSVVTFFQKLAQQSGGRSGPQFLSSHPDPGNRAQDISKILSRFPPKQFQELDTPEFAAAKQALSDTSAGSTEPSEKPIEISRLTLQNIASESFHTFQHKAYVIDYPENWEVTGDPQASATFYPEGGLAGGALAYGVMVSGFQPSPGGSKELDTAVRDLMTDTEQSNPDLRVANSPQAFTLHGRPARKLDWFGKSAVWENGRQLTERVRMIAFQEKTGGIIYVVFVAPDLDFNGLLPVFERMLDSLRIR